MESYEIYFTIGGVFGFLAQAAILVFSIAYYVKLKSIGTLLMTIGSLLGTMIFLSRPLLSVLAGTMGSMEIVKTQGLLSIASSIFIIVFAIGFAMNVLATPKK
ncbi:hypothetical protein R3X28_06840 [Maribacter sp. TH_r10]|uniref:Uncharacterized protein n=1 Tax=Maribacter luteus TaxID=2594478 RepID=A0A6I2MUE8_9FLAO|nr:MULTISPECIES: hypothetical protein [Maribacter]MDV7138584.1 hypothetical protein [Maribacter sp. TH_r10]MRX66044.1 hypothetical protein [Maribacter luteus]